MAHVLQKSVSEQPINEAEVRALLTTLTAHQLSFGEPTLGAVAEASGVAPERLAILLDEIRRHERPSPVDRKLLEHDFRIRRLEGRSVKPPIVRQIPRVPVQQRRFDGSYDVQRTDSSISGSVAILLLVFSPLILIFLIVLVASW